MYFSVMDCHNNGYTEYYFKEPFAMRNFCLERYGLFPEDYYLIFSCSKMDPSFITDDGHFLSCIGIIRSLTVYKDANRAGTMGDRWFIINLYDVDGHTPDRPYAEISTVW